MTLYRHELVHENHVNNYLATGWEPVPDVQTVINRDLATPSTYVFLRKAVSEDVAA